MDITKRDITKRDMRPLRNPCTGCTAVGSLSQVGQCDRTFVGRTAARADRDLERSCAATAEPAARAARSRRRRWERLDAGAGSDKSIAAACGVELGRVDGGAPVLTEPVAVAVAAVAQDWRRPHGERLANSMEDLLGAADFAGSARSRSGRSVRANQFEEVSSVVSAASGTSSSSMRSALAR